MGTRGLMGFVVDGVSESLNDAVEEVLDLREELDADA